MFTPFLNVEDPNSAFNYKLPLVDLHGEDHLGPAFRSDHPFLVVLYLAMPTSS